jgi:hypothetical protein
MRHADSSSQHFVSETKRPESSNAVAGEVQASASRLPRPSTLDDFRNEALRSQRSPERETRDSATDDQNA